MSEKPILFKPELVRKILEGEKTVTRRIVKPQPHYLLHDSELIVPKCPYGEPGDVLWVRETWTPNTGIWMQLYGDDKVLFKADFLVKEPLTNVKWKPSIHMPKKYCRLRLRITDISVERLQDITDDEIKKEGIDIPNLDCGVCGGEIPDNFGNPCKDCDDALRNVWIETWNSINEKRGYSWESNPWLWRIEFEAIQNEGM